MIYYSKSNKSLYRVIASKMSKSKKIIVDDDYEDIIASEKIPSENLSEIAFHLKKKLCSEISSGRPSGLKYYDNVIDEKFSDELFEFLDRENEKKWKSLSDSKKSRKVQHYGYKYDYKSRNITQKGEEIPEIFKPLFDYILTHSDETFNQIIVNNYEPSQGISAHTDVKDYGKVIACFSIGSGAVMRFTSENLSYDLYVKKNSIYIMSGDSRYNWKHEMVSRKSDVVDGKKIQRGRRISITLRKVSE